MTDYRGQHKTLLPVHGVNLEACTLIPKESFDQIWDLSLCTEEQHPLPTVNITTRPEGHAISRPTHSKNFVNVHNLLSSHTSRQTNKRLQISTNKIFTFVKLKL